MSTYDNTGGTAMDSTLETGRHPVNTGHLVMGLVFLGLVGVWALVAGDVVDEGDANWLLPIPWVAGGAIGLAVAAWANMRSRRTTSDRWAAEDLAQPSRDDAPAPTARFENDTPEPTTRFENDDTDPTEEIR